MSVPNQPIIPDPTGKDSSYHYIPTEWICILFVVLFGLSTSVHLGQAIWCRRWFLIPTLVLGGIGEIIGWSARLWSSINIIADTPFLMQISTTIIAPTFLSAANFILLGTVINRAGPQYSRLSAKHYGMIFITADVVALVVQAIGGGMASSADTDKGTADGAHVMLGGIILQMIAITVYAVLGGEFVYRVLTKKPARTITPAEMNLAAPSHSLTDSEAELAREKTAGRSSGLTSRTKLMIFALSFSTLLLFIRAIYRTIELSDGWNGRIISTQVYFNVLDATMVVVSMLTLNILHPGWLLYSRSD